jgi:rubrerythrin
MTHPDLQIEEALEIAIAAELKAHVFYAQAAAWVEDPHGRDLLGRLAAFEYHHYQKLTELARSLRKNGQFIPYEPRTVDQFAPVLGGEVTGAQPEEMKDQASILGRAIDLEKIAGERYRTLAEQTTDPVGQALFRRLAEEERVHQRILEDEFFSLSNQGVWGWSGLYGE